MNFSQKRKAIPLLLFWCFLSVASASPPTCPTYDWPSQVSKIETFEIKFRFKVLTQEMEKFSKNVGECYNREPVGGAEKLWAKSARLKKLKKINKAHTVEKFCAEVRKNLIEDKLSNYSSVKSPFVQYANCQEGSMVGACLAYQFGYSPNEIMMCKSNHDHEWSLVPEPGKAGSFCLLDRWNSVRCGVKLSGRHWMGAWTGDVIVPGEKIFQFTNAICYNLTTRMYSQL